MQDATVVKPGDTELAVYEQVIQADVLEKINGTIDRVRGQWWPPDGRHEAQFASTFFDLLRQSAAFRQAESTACTASTQWADAKLGRPTLDNAIYTVRCVNRQTPSASYLIHFDRHLLTVLIPLQTAVGSNRNGDLILYKRPDKSPRRRFGTRALLFVQQNLPLAMRRRIVERDLRRGRCDRIAVQPGNIYCFNGMVTPHTNLEVDDGERRSLLVHYYEPFPVTAPRRLVRRWRDIRAWISGEIPGQRSTN